MGVFVPVAISRNNIADSEFLRDFLNSQVQRICFQLLTSHGSKYGSWQAHQACCLVICLITPSILLLALLRGVRVGYVFTLVSTFFFSLHAGFSSEQSRTKGPTSNRRSPTLEFPKAIARGLRRILPRFRCRWSSCGRLAVTLTTKTTSVSQGNVVGSGDATSSSTIRHDCNNKFLWGLKLNMCPWVGSPCVVYEVWDRGKTRSRAEKKGKAGGDAYVIIVFSLASSVESSLLELEVSTVCDCSLR